MAEAYVIYSTSLFDFIERQLCEIPGGRPALRGGTPGVIVLFNVK